MFLKKKTKTSTKTSYREQPDGYLETIQKGMSGVRYFNRKMSYGKGTREEQISRLQKEMEAQGFIKDEAGVFRLPEDRKLHMRIPSELIPKCPDDRSDVVMNLRADDSFVEDEGWHRASAAYSDFLRRHENQHVLYLELGVGANTPVIIKYPFWQMTLENERAVYACLNYGEAFCPGEIEERSICIDGDIGALLKEMNSTGKTSKESSLSITPSNWSKNFCSPQKQPPARYISFISQNHPSLKNICVCFVPIYEKYHIKS